MLSSSSTRLANAVARIIGNVNNSARTAPAKTRNVDCQVRKVSIHSAAGAPMT